MQGSAQNISLDAALDHISGTPLNSFDVALADLRYAGENHFRIGTDTYAISPAAWKVLTRYFGLSPDLLPRLSRGLGDLVVRALHKAGRWAPGAPDNVRLVYDAQGTVLAAGSATEACLTNQQVVSAVKEAWPSDISSETLSARLDITETDFELTCHTASLAAEPRPGDILHGGIMIRHSQVGAFPTMVLSYIHRLVCLNGMTQRICLQGKPSRTKRAKVQNSPESTLEAIRRQVSRAWAQLEERLQGIKRLLEHRLDADELPDTLRRRWSLNREVAAEIALALRNDELGQTHTEYDLVNALSRVATHSSRLAPRYRRHLSLAAGMLAQSHIHRCRMCGTWLIGDHASHQLPDPVEADTAALPA